MSETIQACIDTDERVAALLGWHKFEPSGTGYDALMRPTCKRCKLVREVGDHLGNDDMPHYSSDMTAAWKVFIWGLTSFGTASIVADMEDYGRGTFTRGKAEEVVYVTIGECTVVDDAALAICRAALMAVDHERQPAPAASPEEKA